MKKITLLFAAMACYVFSNAQAPQLQWSKLYGGSEDEYAFCIEVCHDGYLIAGHSKSYGHANGNYDVYLLKIDLQGNVVWEKTYGGSQDEGILSCKQTHDGGYILCGNTRSWAQGLTDAYMLKVNSSGDSLWSKHYGGQTGDGFHSGIPVHQGGFAFSGFSSVYMQGDQFYFVKTEGDGDSSWTYTVGGADQDYGIYTRQTDFDGFITVGHTWSEGDESQVYLVMTDENGGWNWTKAFGGPLEDYGKWIDVTDEPGYVIVGSTQSYGHGSSDFWLVNTDNEGNPMDTYTFGGGASETANGASRDVDGGILMAGDTWSFGVEGPDVFFMKATEEGDSLWAHTWGDEHWQYAYDIKPTLDGGYIVVGRHYSTSTGDNQILVLKYGSNPFINSVMYERYSLNKPILDFQQTYDTITIDIPEDANIIGMVVYLDEIIHPRIKDLYIKLWHLDRTTGLVARPLGGGANFINTVLHPAATILANSGQGPLTGVYRPNLSVGGIAMNPDPNQYILIVDDASSNNEEGTLNAWRLQVFYEGAAAVEEPGGQDGSLIEVFPNPCKGEVRLRYLIRDSGYLISDLYMSDGRKVCELVRGERAAGDYEISVDASNLPSGVYFVRVQLGDEVAVRKLVVNN
jgi:hypothetical protein